MRKFALIYLCPLLFSTAFIFIFYEKINAVFFHEESSVAVDSSYCYLENFNNNQYYENQFLSSHDTAATIFLLGSSELGEQTEAIPYRFIPGHYGTKLIGIGHAGNQCLSIFAQLLANENRLKDAPVVIILSPGWFESKPSMGTSSAVFLEYNSERFLNNILLNENDPEFQAYLYKRIGQLFNEFNSPSLELKLMNFKYRASKSFVHRAVYAPLIFCDHLLMDLKEKIKPTINLAEIPCKRVPIVPESILINWDSLYTISRDDVLKRSTNNKMCIADEYYTQYIHGKKGHIEPVREDVNQELQDFMMLMNLLKKKKANASFIITPLNPYYYQNLNDITPTIDIVKNKIKDNGFSCLNLFETDTAKYEKAALIDVMHLSDYSWYKVDQFIVNTYHLSK